MEKEITLPKKDWLKKHANSYIIKPDGTIDEITPTNNKFYTLEEMYEHCNCELIQPVYLPEGRVMICDEEGALKSDKQQNWVATKIVADAAKACGQTLEYFIYGNVMIIKDSEWR